MADAVEICNGALTLLGGKAIASLDDDTKAARACNRVYDSTRLLLLQAHPWNFAMARASLAALSTSPLWEFDNAFSLPADCLFVKKINSTEAWNVEGTAIHTDEGAPLTILYMSDVTDPNVMTPLFRAALSARIALDIGYDMTGNATLLTTMKTIYDERLSGARTNDAQEGTPDAIEQGSWIDSRV